MRKVGVFCLVLAAGLLLLLAFLHSQSRPISSTENAPPIVEPTNTNADSRLRAARGTLSWKDIENPDYKQYVENLRNMGCPAATVEDIIVADVNALFLEKARPILASLKESLVRFYTTHPGGKKQSDVIGEATKALDALNRQRLELIAALIGYEVDRFKTAATPWAHSMEQIVADDFAFLPPEKAARIAELRKRLRDETRSRIPSNRPLTRDELQFMQKSRRTYQAEVERLLTPEEFQTYLLHNSIEGGQLGSKLQKLTVSEDEFRQLLDATWKFSREHDVLYPTNNVQATHRADEAEAKLLEQFRAALGEERYQAFIQQNDPVYRDIDFFSAQAQLTRRQVEQLYDLTIKTQREIGAVRAMSLAETERREKISRLVSEAEKQLDGILPASTRADYLQSRAGTWLKRNPTSQFRTPIGQANFVIQ